MRNASHNIFYYKKYDPSNLKVIRYCNQRGIFTDINT
jgi:hypothetical protein